MLNSDKDSVFCRTTEKTCDKMIQNGEKCSKNRIERNILTIESVRKVAKRS